MGIVKKLEVCYDERVMDITFLGHSTFKLKGKSATVIIDPFDPKMVGLKFPKNSADIVTVSHDHSDHNFVEGVADVKRIVKGPGEYEIAGVSIVGYNTYHDDKKGEERGKNTIYVYEMDELRLCHLGDLGHELSSSLVEDIGNIDVLMIPVGGTYTINSEVAAKVNQSIEASIVIPMHYSESGLNEDIKAKLSPVEDFLKLTGLSVEKTDKLSLKRSDVSSEGQKIVVLEQK